MTEQPKEYIITEEQIKKHASLSVAYGVCPVSDIGKMHKISTDLNALEFEIRSRPVSTPPEGAAPEQMPTVTTNDVGHRKPRLGPDGSTSAPDREGSRHVSRNCGEHDAAIRQAEREEVLKDAEQRFRDIGMSATHEAVVLQVLNSLRQHKGEP